jgi:hypothetical protein
VDPFVCLVWSEGRSSTDGLASNPTEECGNGRYETTGNRRAGVEGPPETAGFLVTHSGEFHFVPHGYTPIGPHHQPIPAVGPDAEYRRDEGEME